jgi:hypothetical protein
MAGREKLTEPPVGQAGNPVPGHLLLDRGPLGRQPVRRGRTGNRTNEADLAVAAPGRRPGIRGPSCRPRTPAAATASRKRRSARPTQDEPIGQLGVDRRDEAAMDSHGMLTTLGIDGFPDRPRPHRQKIRGHSRQRSARRFRIPRARVDELLKPVRSDRRRGSGVRQLLKCLPAVDLDEPVEMRAGPGRIPLRRNRSAFRGRSPRRCRSVALDTPQ